MFFFNRVRLKTHYRKATTFLETYSSLKEIVNVIVVKIENRIIYKNKLYRIINRKK